MPWVERVEALISVLKGSSIEEIELIEGELKILIRRSPGNIVVARSLPPMDVEKGDILAPRSTLDMKSPLTGVYYSAASPTTAPFINVGDSVTVGQTIALIEAMKVFSEVASEVSGRVVAIKVQEGNVVKKGDVLFQVEPAFSQSAQ